MYPYPVRTHLQHVSLATWATLRAPAVAIGVLALFLTGCNQIFDLDKTELNHPNYYPCACECSPNVVAPGAAVYTSPGGLFINFVPIGSLGSILDGPEEADFNGNPATWWQVQFDTGLEGWVRQDLLALSGVQPVFAKNPKVCLPEDYNYYLGGTMKPTVQIIQGLCAGDVATEASARVKEKFAFSAFCQCDAQNIGFDEFDASCSAPCPDGLDVCLVAGSDPPDPTPEPLSAAVFQPTSECEVAGEAFLSANGHEPKQQPTLEGVLQIHGSPCPPDEGCRVGMSYQLTGDDIEFDSGSIFADDPKFVDLGLSGATEPEAINLGPFLAGYLGEIPAGTAFSSAHARRSGSSDGFVINGRNNEGLALAMNWEDKACRIAGQIVGQAEGDGDEGTFDAQVDVALDGFLVNQPPRPYAGADQTVECTSPDGADVTLDASGSTDADNNIALYEWRRGSEDGPQVTAPSLNPVVQTQQALGDQTYYLLVVDGRLAADGDSVGVSVADTTAPQISCNAPATIFPSDVPEKRREGISFTATAEDSCTGVSAVMIDSVACTKPESCKVGIQGATLTIYDSGGIGDIISWIVSAQDAAGNASQKTCELRVIKKTK